MLILSLRAKTPSGKTVCNGSGKPKQEGRTEFGADRQRDASLDLASFGDDVDQL